MRVVIIGSGNAGQNLAAKLCEEKHDVILVEGLLDSLLLDQLRLKPVMGIGAGGTARRGRAATDEGSARLAA